MTASKERERNMKGKRLRSETSESASTLGNGSSCMERTMWQQACQVAQLHQTMERMARMLEVHMARAETPWLGMNEWLEDREPMWDDRQRGQCTMEDGHHGYDR